MAKRLLCYLVFTVLMTLSVAGSAIIVLFLYLPFVALKAVWLAMAGKVSLRVPEQVPDRVG